MSDQEKKGSNPRRLLEGLAFGMLFGFLLQKGGVGKYSILMGQLLLQDWTVVKIMMTAVVVGMLGVYTMKWLGLVDLHVKKTVVGANIVGGLIFGVGFGLTAYCPGTNLSALGQGNWDAILVVGGLLAGSYLFAESSEWAKRKLARGDSDKRTLPEIIGINERVAVGVAVVILTLSLIALEILT